MSLAEFRGRPVSVMTPGGEWILVTRRERDALVELAEAYLAVRDFDKRPKGMGFGGAERQFAQERLNMAANQVRP